MAHLLEGFAAHASAVPAISLNPFDWSSRPFIVLIAVSLLLRLLLPPARTRLQQFGHELLLVTPAALFYFMARGLVDARDAEATANALDVIRLEQRLHLFHERALQNLIVGSDALVTLVNWIYIWMHWPVVITTVTWLVVRRPSGTFSSYRNAFLISGGIGIFVFALYPVAPPRLVEGYGFVDTVTARSSSYRVLQPTALTNPYAAMPSLHFGWNLLIGIAIVRESRSLVPRLFGAVMPALMFAAIVLTANHFILDGIAGGALAFSSLLLALNLPRFNRWWQLHVVTRLPRRLARPSAMRSERDAND
jgi:hypothetical protein